MAQFAKRKINVTFNLGEGSFGENLGSDVTVSGHCVSLSLALPGAGSQTTAHFRIYGLPLDMINKLTRIGPINGQFRVNKVLIEAGDEGGAMSVVHMGTIETAFADFNQAPDAVFEVISRAGFVEAIRPVGARSYPGAVDAADVLSDLAAMIGAAFERNGVSVMLQNPYFPGTAWEQIKSCAEAAGIDYSFDRGILAIWKRGTSRQTAQPARVAPDTGMVGYPTFNSQGIAVRTLFNQDITNGVDIDVESQLSVANGRWHVYGSFHTLESETPNGQWFTDALCQRGLTNG